MPHPPRPAENTARLFMALLAWLLFVVYGSLVPLDFNPASIEIGWRRFKQMPMLEIGPESRADWISNIVLYVPVGFLSATWLSRALPRLSMAGVLGLAACSSAALAVAVEFAQTYFPPRTVALNDIAAEIIGSGLGIALANRSTQWLVGLIGGTHSGVRQFSARLLAAYAAAYVLYALFPFDFVLNEAELSEKLRSETWGWWTSGGGQSILLALLKPALEVLLALPLGWFLASRLKAGASAIGQGAVLGALLGVTIELAQLFMVSGSSQGLSVLTRSLGLGAGVWIWQRRRRALDPEQWASLARAAAPMAVPLYLIALAQANHLLSTQWLDWHAGLDRLAEVRFVPFFYHYYTTEMQALHSLAWVALSYAPIGLCAWALRTLPLAGTLMAAGLAAMIEACKLWLPGLGIHPDPTNLLTAASAAWLTHLMMTTLARGAVEGSVAPTITRPNAQAEGNAPHPGLSFSTSLRPGAGASSATAATVRTALFRNGLIGLPLLIGGLVIAAGFPIAAIALTCALMAASVAVWIRPTRALTLCLVAVPAVQLAPWSGRLYIDELDAVFACLLGVAAWRCPPAKPASKRRPDILLWLVCGAVTVALLVGLGRTVWPWLASESGILGATDTPLNALRIAKGAIEAAGFLGVMHLMRRGGIDTRGPVAKGLLIGLALTLAFVVWERAAFVGLLDFASDYRVTGPFADMNVGGAYIECFMVLATPFLIIAYMHAHTWSERAVLATLTCGLAYGLTVTFSRSGLAGFALAAALTIAVVLRQHAGATSRAWQALMLAALVGVAGLPAYFGSFSQARWAVVETDLDTRLRHWAEGLQMRKPDAVTSLFGVGIGSFPEAYYWNSKASTRRGSFRLVRDIDGNVLRLGAGHAMYVEQFVNVQPGQRYTLRIRVRSEQAQVPVQLSVCERWLLTALNCVNLKLASGVQPNAWHDKEVAFDTLSFASQAWYAQRTVKLAILSPPGSSSIEVGRLSVQAIDGPNLIANGDFAKGLDHWSFSADDHLAWHLKSMPVALLFDLGWFGVLAFAGLVILAATRAARRAWRGDAFAAATLAALAGFLTVGLFDTLIDTPRFMFLFMVLCGIAARPPHRTSDARKGQG